MKNFIKEISKFELLTKEETYLLFEKYQNGSKEAKDKLINHNLRWVVNIASKYSRFDSLEVLVQEGILGLIRAVEKFKINKGYAFSTYAYHWIKQAIFRYLDNNGIIRIPVYIKELFYKEEKGIGLTEEEKEEKELILSEKDKEKIKSARLALSTLESDRPSGDGIVLGDLMIDNKSHLVNDEKFELELKVKLLKEVFKCFKPREREILIRRSENETLESIGEIFDLTRERIRQIEVKSLKRIKNIYKNKTREEVLLNVSR